MEIVEYVLETVLLEVEGKVDGERIETIFLSVCLLKFSFSN